MQTEKMWVRSMDWEDSLKEGMTTRPCICAWRIPWTGSLVGYSPQRRKEMGHDSSDLACAHPGNREEKVRGKKIHPGQPPRGQRR